MTTELNLDTPIGELLDLLNIDIEDLPSMLAELQGITPSEQKKTYPGKTLLLRNGIETFIQKMGEKKTLNKPKFSKASVETYGLELNLFAKFMDNVWDGDLRKNESRVVSNVRSSDIDTYLCQPSMPTQKPVKPATYNKKRTIIQSFFTHLLESNIIPKSPADKAGHHPSDGDKPIMCLSKTELERILVQSKTGRLGTRNFTIIFLLVNTGLRIGELYALNINDFNFRENALMVRNGKGGKERKVYFTDEVGKYMLTYIRTHRIGCFAPLTDEPLFVHSSDYKKRLSRSSLKYIIEKIFRTCNISEGGAHRLRHSYAVNALKNHMSQSVIQRQLGHAHSSTTDGYLRLLGEDIRAEVNAHFSLAFSSIYDIADTLEDKS